LPVRKQSLEGPLPKSSALKPSQQKEACVPDRHDVVHLPRLPRHGAPALHVYTKTGLPTAAVYVFVNICASCVTIFLRPISLAVFDVAAKTFRDTQAEAITSVSQIRYQDTDVYRD